VAITLRDSATSTANNGTIVAPGSIQAGDLLVLLDKDQNTSGSPADTVPSGFTRIHTGLQDPGIGTIEQRVTLSYKIATGAEAGATLTGINGTATGVAGRILLVFAPSSGTLFTGVTVNDAALQQLNTNPVSETILSGSGTPPLIALAGYVTQSAAISPRTFSPAADGEVTAAQYIYLAYKIYEASPSNITVDMDDEGNMNALSTCYLRLAIVSQGAGSSAGSSTVSGIGASISRGVGASAGVATVSGVGASTADAVGAAAGETTVDGVGQALAADSAGLSEGASTVTGVGETTIYGTGASDAVATVTGVGASVAFAVGESDGVSTVTGLGAAVKDIVGTSNGVATITGEGASVAEAVGNAAGTCTVTAIQYIIAVGNASGTAIVFGDASTIAETDGLAVGSATVVGFLLADAEADGEVLAESLVNGIGASVAHAVGGDVEGIAEVLGIGSTITWGAEDGTSGTWTPEEAAPDGWIPEAAQGGGWTQ
jgi:hypothetical protein